MDNQLHPSRPFQLSNSDAADTAETVVATAAATAAATSRLQQRTHFGGGRWKYVNCNKAGSPTVSKSSKVQAATATIASAKVKSPSAATATATATGSSSTAVSNPNPSPNIQKACTFIDFTATLKVGDRLRFRKDFTAERDIWLDNKLEEHTIDKIVLWTKVDPCNNGPETKYFSEYIVHFGGERWVSALYDKRLFEKVGTDVIQSLTDYDIVESTTRRSWDDVCFTSY